LVGRLGGRDLTHGAAANKNTIKKAEKRVAAEP
jgi:hypothetical protein